MHHHPHVIALAFGKPNDYGRLMNSLYAPGVSAVIDPDGYVISRPEAVRKSALADAGAAILSDAKHPEIILAATFAYHARRRYREIGSTRSRLPGAGRVSVALVTLDQARRHPGQTLVAAVQRLNGRSLSAYEHFSPIGDMRAGKLCEFTGKEPAPPGEKTWLECTAGTLREHALIALDTRRRGLVTRGGVRIPVDASALDRAGLTEAYLEEIACASRPGALNNAHVLSLGS